MSYSLKDHTLKDRIAETIEESTRYNARLTINIAERGMLRIWVSPMFHNRDYLDTVNGISGDELARIRAKAKAKTEPEEPRLWSDLTRRSQLFGRRTRRAAA